MLGLISLTYFHKYHDHLWPLFFILWPKTIFFAFLGHFFGFLAPKRVYIIVISHNFVLYCIVLHYFVLFGYFGYSGHNHSQGIAPNRNASPLLQCQNMLVLSILTHFQWVHGHIQNFLAIFVSINCNIFIGQNLNQRPLFDRNNTHINIKKWSQIQIWPLEIGFLPIL